MKHSLWMSICCPSITDAIEPFVSAFSGGIHPPLALDVDRLSVSTSRELHEAARSATQGMFVDYTPEDAALDSSQHFLMLRVDRVHGIRVPNYFTRAEEVLSLIEDLPGTLFAMNSVWPDEWPDDRTVRRYGFSDGHTDLGWACAFKGAGHDRLISRRWLDHGPWRVLRGKNDTTLIQFHDLALGPEESFAQASIAHDKMGISRNGCFIQEPIVYFTELKGLYDAATKTFKMVVHGRDLSQMELLDAATYRIDKRNDPDTPIENVAYIFIDSAEADKYLHDCWLRELQCWTFKDGAEVRLDDSYHPNPNSPNWVKAFDGG